jgi:hypothetical protein
VALSLLKSSIRLVVLLRKTKEQYAPFVLLVSLALTYVRATKVRATKSVQGCASSMRSLAAHRKQKSLQLSFILRSIIMLRTTLAARAVCAFWLRIGHWLVVLLRKTKEQYAPFVLLKSCKDFRSIEN